ncbi:MAG: tRNA preQ1(34) S-adenosylmethionine ribosyltransferase-isomerase QueA [Alphaproteobacteria bacterium]|nr:MAG: tRNA preQ1(34) S-adenosylmethionine ribosyltransferase-isomerase QueA [Alphaproteobacteria bacterium]
MNATALTLKDFDFDLPQDRIASRPISPRDTAKLLVVKDGGLMDRQVCDLPQLLRAGDLLVFNDTKVIPARLIGDCNGRKIEVLLHRPSAGNWQAMARPAKKLRLGDTIVFGKDFSAEVRAKDPEQGFVYLRLLAKRDDIMGALAQYGHIPIPPYFNREDDEQDKRDYQTIFAKSEGAVAAPTAGLHFTESLLNNLKQSGIDHAFVTLHVGAGTFAPVRAEKLSDHVMHAEWYDVSPKTADKISEVKKNGGRVVAIGTTVARSLESAGSRGEIAARQGETQIFITPGYSFKIVDILFTNFHLPQSTLLMLVSAFAGMETIKNAYAHAIANQYRFYSYGDACLLFPGK